MGRLRAALAAAAIGAVVATQAAAAAESDEPPPSTTTTPEPPAIPEPSEPEGPPAKPPAEDEQKPKPKPPAGEDRDGKANGGKRGRPGGRGERGEKGEPAKERQEAKLPPLRLGSASCDTTPPAYLIPLYQGAAERYRLGPAGPAILAAINEIESGFGVNMGPSSAGAVGPMQFLPSSWEAYGVDADGDGRRNVWDPDDAIYAAARYLRIAGMPEDPEGAIFAYNHADWYVADVLARAACFSGLGGLLGGVTLVPERQQISCVAAPGRDNRIPKPYLDAFEVAATRYELGKRGVWAMAAVARLESNFGRGMTPAELAESGPLGISEESWREYAVDGDGDGRVVRRSPADSAATLGRMIWASGDLRAGLFAHNHAAWYVEEVLGEARGSAGSCRLRPVAYSIVLPGPVGAPVNWANVELSNSLEAWDLQRGAIDARVIALIGAISREHTMTLSSLRSDHSMYASSGNVSNHYYGRAMDIAAVDGVSCTLTSPDGPCGRLARALAALPPGVGPTELIYCFDPDGPGPAWAQADHCDHIHAGFDSWSVPARG